MSIYTWLLLIIACLTALLVVLMIMYFRQSRGIKASKKALVTHEYRLKQALRIAKLGHWELRPNGDLYWSNEVLDIFEINNQVFQNKLQNFYDRVKPEDVDHVIKTVSDAWITKAPFDLVYRIRLSDDQEKTLCGRGEVFCDASGSPLTMLGSVQDITEHTKFEEKLRQSQKMEVVGNLAGGVAHDFNNILAVIQGYAELLSLKFDESSKYNNAIIAATRRGNDLTKRLLTFSRQQPLDTQQLSVEKLIYGMSDLIERAIGSSVRIETNIAPDLPDIFTDANQLESALLNLVINARDAMQDGGVLQINGKITVITRADTAKHADAILGNYVQLTVSDNGEGMTEEVLERVFEPFYTTKGPEKGTGLGLSSIHSFIKQAKGFCRVESVQGAGTKMHIFLPIEYATTNEFSKLQPMLNQPQESSEPSNEAMMRGQLISEES